MSNAQLEELQERELARRVADALGITLDDLDETEWSLEENASDDGVVSGLLISFSEGSSAAVLGKIRGLQHGRWIQIAPL